MNGEPLPPGRPVLTSLAAPEAPRSTAPGQVVRLRDAGDLPFLQELDRERVAWVEVPLDLAHRRELDDFSVDVVLTDPAAQAGHLYRLARLREPARPRLTMPTTPGFGGAAAVAMALQFPLRLVPVQPGPAELRELEEVLGRYLHDAGATQPVEPFQSALAVLLQGEGPTLWEALERDPAWFRRDPPEPGLEEPEAVTTRLGCLLSEGAECSSCPLTPWCAGWFKWPDPSYDCAGVRRLFAALEVAAERLRADLREAREAFP